MSLLSYNHIDFLLNWCDLNFIAKCKLLFHWQIRNNMWLNNSVSWITHWTHGMSASAAAVLTVAFNSLRSSDAYMCEQTIQSLVKIMACRLFSDNPLSEPMMVYYQLHPKEHITMKFYLKFISFHSRKWKWKCEPAKMAAILSWPWCAKYQQHCGMRNMAMNWLIKWKVVLYTLLNMGTQDSVKDINGKSTIGLVSIPCVCYSCIHMHAGQKLGQCNILPSIKHIP